MGELWIPALYAGLGHFAFVFFKAFQQRNVAFLHYRWVTPVSFLMSTTEVVVVSLVAVEAVGVDKWYHMAPMAFCLGLGGAVGSILAMWLHDKYLTRRPS